MNLQGKLYRSIYEHDPTPITTFIRWLAVDYGLPEPLSILDIGCGTGRMLHEYAQRGWDVVGMEPDLDYCKHAREVAGQYPGILVQQGGFNDIAAIEKYDLITAINDPFSYLLSVEMRVDGLARAFQALKPGGVLFLDCPNFLWLLKFYREPPPHDFVLEGQSVQCISHHEFDFHDAVWTHTDEFFVGELREKVIKTHRLAIISPVELLYFVQKQGYARIQTYNSYHARASEHWHSSRMMLSAQKPG